MPLYSKLKVGDKIRLLCVPEADFRQRERELREGREEAGSTANALERAILHNPVVTITWIDEYGLPWIDYELKAADGTLIEDHSFAVMEDESWEVYRPT